MAKKINKFNVLLMAAILLTAVCFALSASGHESEFIKNYSKNFKKNMVSITQKLNIPLPEHVRTAWAPSPSPYADETEITNEPDGNGETPVSGVIATATPGVQPSAPVKSAIDGVSVTMPFENASTAKYIRYKDYLVCANQTAIMAFDKGGNALWAVAVQMTDPILKADGNYIMLAERGGKKICLFNDKKMLYSNETEDTIISAAISSNGDIVAVTKKEYYQGSVSVYNKEGKQIFVWNSGNYAILDAAISGSSRTLAVSLLNATEGVKSEIMFFDITKTESNAQKVYDNTILYDIEFFGDVLNGIGDDKTVGVNTKGREVWNTSYDGKTLTSYHIDDAGNKLFAFDHNNVSLINVLDTRGKVKAAVNAEIIPDFLEIHSGYIVYNSNREIILSNLSGKDISKYTCSKDIQNLVLLDNKTVVAVYNSNIEFVRLG